MTPTPTLRAQRAGVTPFPGTGVGGMAHPFPEGERLRSPFPGKGVAALVDLGIPERIPGTCGAPGAPAVAKGCA